MYEEAHVLALKMARWHPDNRADLAILVKLDADGDRVAEITASPDFRKELAAIHLRRDLNCAAWLQSHCWHLARACSLRAACHERRERPGLARTWPFVGWLGCAVRCVWC